MRKENAISYLKRHKIRWIVGILVLIVELFLYFGTRVMQEEETDFLSGEGSFEEAFTEEHYLYRQTFRPAHRNLESVSFLVNLTDVEKKDGVFTARITDGKGAVLAEKEWSYEDVSDGSYTDMTVNLRLSVQRKYCLILSVEPSSAGEYATVSICDTSWKLPESKGLERSGDGHPEELPGLQLVTRYVYADAIAAWKIWVILLICLLTAGGVIFAGTDDRCIRWGLGLFLLAAVPVVLGWQMEKLTFAEVYKLPITMRFRTLDYLPFALRWNLAILIGIELMILLCSHSVRVSLVMTDVLITIVYSVNYFVIGFRGTPLRVSDLSAAGTAMKVVGQYSFVPNSALAVAWGTAILFAVWAVHTPASGRRKRVKGAALKGAALYAGTAAAAVCITMAAGYELLYTDLLERVGFVNDEFKGFYQDMLYYRNGYLVATCIEVRNSRIVPMEGYSVQRVEQILSHAEDEDKVRSGETAADKEDMPHVILIMNESFADLRVLADLELSEENLKYFNSLKENTVRGYVNASVIGGGTANSEFEVFTGCSMAFFSVNYYPYQQAIKKPLNSLVSTMKAQGYTTVSMHPESESNWNRTNVYRYLGFDESLWKRDFEGAEVIHSGVSDAETYKRIEEIYENRQVGEKLFLFDLTMQNHGDYFGHEAPYDVQETSMKRAPIDEYLSLIKISDEAFEELVRYFEKEDEKVIICMYGDHQPWLSDLILTEYKGSAAAEPSNLMNKYKTPFVIWANYDIEEADGYDISMNYLGGLLCRTAGIPMSPYFHFLEEQRERFPIITVNGYVDCDGVYHNWDGADSGFEDYRMLQYNYLYDEAVSWGY